MASKGTDINLRCSFCKKTQGQVKKLIAGPDGVFICDATPNDVALYNECSTM